MRDRVRLLGGRVSIGSPRGRRRRGRGAFRSGRPSGAGKFPGSGRNRSRAILPIIEITCGARAGYSARRRGRASEDAASRALSGAGSRPCFAELRRRGERKHDASNRRRGRDDRRRSRCIHGRRTRADTIVLPTFDVVATTPLGGGEINVSQSPFAVWQTNRRTSKPSTIRRSPRRWPARRRASPSATSPATNSSRTSSIAVSTRPRSPARRRGLPYIRTGRASTRRSATSSIGTSSRRMRSTRRRSSPQTRFSASTPSAARSP